MAIADIEELCKGFCELAGAAPPALTRGADGTRAATIRMEGVDVAMQQFADRYEDIVFLAADLGEPPAGRELEAWRLLMEANLRMTGTSAPSFSRSPVTGRAVLHWPCPLMEATVTDFRRRVIALVEAARQWREDHFLDDSTRAHAWFLRDRDARTLPLEAFDADLRRFDELVAAACSPEGPPRTALGPAGRTRHFDFDCDGERTRVVQSVDADPGCLFILASLGPSDASAALEECAALMELGFHLATGNTAARIGREAAGDPSLVCAFTLAGASPARLHAACRMAARIALDWRRDSREARATALSNPLETENHHA
ncbi:MAG TPA: CesT family type III secretion system chaperone [Ramlibacter sp.]|uniref:CesT family type III secretion system chaperone n=1 Tax=Ramlibacter sp. TaxID=1917967 RepID=UPI002D01ED7F|nr:CesT family type III secretion system chaperone [Ramlibacter sp.]HVZ46012.1 CesT family type III secretion system chaperone [Ramlibacter sp.]